MLKSKILILILSILFLSCATEDKALMDQKRQYGNVVSVHLKCFTINIPSDMYIVTNDYYTKGNLDRIRISDWTIDKGHYVLSVSDMQEWFRSINCLLYAQKPSYAQIQIFSFPCEENLIIELGILETGYVTEVIDWIFKKREEKVIELMKPPSELKIQNIDITNIGSRLFLEFTKTYGEHIVDEKYYCVKKDEYMIVITFESYGSGYDSNFEKRILESVVFIGE